MNTGLAANPDSHGAPAVAMNAQSLTVTPISGSLGLGDVVLRAPLVRAPRAIIRDVARPDAQVQIFLRQLGEGRDIWTGRFQIPGADAAPIRQVDVEVVDGSSTPLLRGTFGLELDARRRSPDWALGATWYQIFPERFRNGHAGNDPHGPDVTRAKWNSDWFSVSADELEAARARHAGKTFERRLVGDGPGGILYEHIASDRRYGGDLQGVVQKLAHIQSLGVNVIYLNPIFDAPSHHKYDARDFRHVDPTLADPGDSSLAPPTPSVPAPINLQTDPRHWTWTDADVFFTKSFLPTMHAQGIRVVLDGVWNHVGRSHWAFQDVELRGQDSAFSSWFQVEFATPKDQSDPRAHQLDTREGALIRWKAWDGRNGSLPNFARTPEGRLAPPVEDHIFHVTKRWMDPDGDGDPRDGIDGFRLDVASDVPMPFWKAWRTHVRSINPNAGLWGEVWFDAKDYFDGVAFDGQMNYPFTDAVLRFVSGQRDAAWLERTLLDVFHHAPHTDLSQMNLLGSHDTERLTTRIDRMLRDPKAEPNEPPRRTRDSRPPSDQAVRRSLLALAIQATYPGSPMIYAGDELGMWGGQDPDCRKPLPWPDLGPYARPDEEPDLARLTEYQRWLGLRSHPVAGPILKFGDVRGVRGVREGSGGSVTDVDAETFSETAMFIRELSGRQVLVMINRSMQAVTTVHLVPKQAELLVGQVVDGSSVAPESAAAWLLPRDE